MSNLNDYEQGNDSGLAITVASGTDDSFGINRPPNLTTNVGDTFKKFSIRQNGLQPSNTLRNTPHGYHVRQEKIQMYSGILTIVLLVSKAMKLYTSRAHKSVRKCHSYFIFYATDTKNKLQDSGTESCGH
jgi:hypothetical protein